MPRAGRAAFGCRPGRTTRERPRRRMRLPLRQRQRRDARSPGRSTVCWPPGGPRPRSGPPRPPMTPSTCAASTSTWSARSRRPPRRATSSTTRARTSASRLVESLLDSPAYLTHATETYRTLLLPEADDATARCAAVAPTFEAWLRKKVSPRTSATTRSSARCSRSGWALWDGGAATRRIPRAEPSPLAYYVAKDAKPENLAAGAARTFLGVRLECAQCHNHPVRPLEARGVLGPGRLLRGRLEAGQGRRARRDPRGRRPPRGGDPRDEQDRQGRVPRRQEARSGGAGRPGASSWPTGSPHPTNPYFARAAVNRVWARFFGTGIVDPVDDLRAGQPAVAPRAARPARSASSGRTATTSSS